VKGRVRLLLFDVDGTLVVARGAGRAAMARAFDAVYGTRGDIDRYDFRGKTDPRAAFDILGAAGLPDAAIAARLDDCFKRYVEELRTIVGDGSRIVVMPGVVDIVRALHEREDVIVGLLTGNVEGGARVKLEPTGLWPLFRVGAFGSDDADRRCLPAVACRRAHEICGHDVPFERVTIIGDTPLDVDCARACGAVAVAVATGNYAIADLAACTPDALFADFSDVDRTIATLVGLPGVGPAGDGVGSVDPFLPRDLRPQTSRVGTAATMAEAAGTVVRDPAPSPAAPTPASPTDIAADPRRE
jgi:phosphoglycolate phosphatase-like HAD superfamily hydrolase